MWLYGNIKQTVLRDVKGLKGERRNRQTHLLGEEAEGKVRLGLGTVLVEARPCALEIAASLEGRKAF